MAHRHRFPVLLFLLLLAGAAGASAQPFGSWLAFQGHPTHGYVRIPHHAALNPTTAVTIEAWVAVTDATGGGCSSIIGKDYKQAYWLGICGTQLRSYFRGIGTSKTGGVVPAGWTHVAAVFGGGRHKHYINGELVMDVAEAGPATTSPDEVRIGSDVSFPFTPAGAIDEVRLWNVARTQAQIRSTINVVLTSPQPGLVGVWDGPNDVIGSHDGSIQGAGVTIWTFPVVLDCGSSTATSMCLQDHFLVTAQYRVGAPGTAEGTAHVLGCAGCTGSGIFWFFNVQNWELMLKVINGCGLNDRFWVFNAGITNLFFRVTVLDVKAGVQKMYFNYPGPPAPAVTDTSAFATCP